MPNYLGDTEFDNLNTNFYYTSLNEAYYDCKDEKFYNAAEEKLKKNYWKEDVSDKILKALCYVYRKRSEYNYESDICKYLYFWLGNILLDKMRHNTVFFDVIRDLFNILINDKGEICKIPHYYTDVNSFKNVKFFFDYSEDYYSYENQITEYNPPCNNNYKEYLQKYVDTYNKFQIECQDKRPYYSYCDVFDEYFAKKNTKNLSNWTCKLEHNEPKEIKESDDSETTEEQLPKTYSMEERSPNFRGGYEGVREQNTEYTDSSNYLSHQDTSVNNSASDQSDGTPSTIISKSVTGAVSLAGALVPSYLLYNYTPAGNLINKLLGRTTRMNHNPLMEAQLMNNFYQPEGFNSEKSGYYISYRPV
ncbi:VIR protein [Plasmodium vivax]|uniref:VIR protein n=1 Tax=Plasmodium vivax TaxID=5855 RepID=A0A1G4ECJ9_PLAVI|nr:VIR protein [Plasmodium vivax]